MYSPFKVFLRRAKFQSNEDLLRRAKFQFVEIKQRKKMLNLQRSSVGENGIAKTWPYLSETSRLYATKNPPARNKFWMETKISLGSSLSLAPSIGVIGLNFGPLLLRFYVAYFSTIYILYLNEMKSTQFNDVFNLLTLWFNGISEIALTRHH